MQVKCCGLNRVGLRSRVRDPPAQGDFTSDELFIDKPRAILGEERVGIAADNGGRRVFKVRDTVVTYFYGIGKAFDGAYAEYTLALADYVYKIDTKLPFQSLSAILATFMTAWGSLYQPLHIHNGDALLIHGGILSVGTAAIILAKRAGCHVAATTRQIAKADQRRQTGADGVLIDGGDRPLAEQLRNTRISRT